MEETKEETKEPVNILSVLNYGQLFTVKGRTGIYNLIAPENKAGMIAVKTFLGCGITHVKRDSLTCLGQYVYHLSNGTTITIKDVFLNIERNIKAIEDSESLVSAMELIVPGFDPEEFKSHNAEKTLKLYYFIKGAAVAVIKSKDNEN